MNSESISEENDKEAKKEAQKILKLNTLYGFFDEIMIGKAFYTQRKYCFSEK